MSDVVVKFVGDADSLMREFVKLEQKIQSLENTQKQGSTRAKAQNSEQINQVKQWQAANDQAMSAEVANIERRKQMIERAKAVSIKAQQEEAKAAHRASEEKKAYLQGVADRARKMEEEHAARLINSQKRIPIQRELNTLRGDREAALDQERIRSAIKLSQIRKSEMAAANARNTVPDPTLWEQATSGATGYLTKMFAIGTAVNLIGDAIGAVMEKNKAWSNSIGELDKRTDDMRAKLGVQLGGGGDKVAGKALERSADIAMSTPSVDSIVKAGDITRKLSSAGFDSSLVKSGILEEQANRLNILTGNFGEGADHLAGAEMLIKQIKSLAPGTKITNELIQDLVTEIGNSFQLSTAEKPELSRFFMESGLLTAMGGERKENLALFTMAQETLGADRAGTGMRRFVDAMNVVEEGSKEEGLLSELDIGRTDLHTSKTGSVMASAKKLEAAMKAKGWDKIKRDNFRKVFFGQEASPVAEFALSNEDRISERAGMLGDQAATETVRRDFLKSDLAIRNRQQLESEKLQTREAERAGVTFEDIERAAKLAFNKHRAEAGGDLLERNKISIEEAATGKLVESAKAIGASPEAFANDLQKEILFELRKQSGYLESSSRRRSKEANIETSPNQVLGSY